MTVLQGIILGVVQGIAEFLPISSSGHLQLIQTLFGLEEVPLLYDVFLHLATLFAVCIYFRQRIWKLLKIFGRWISKKERSEAVDEEDLLCGSDEAGRRTIIAIIITTAITGAIGIVTSKLIPDLSIKYVCAGFLVTAFLLIISFVITKKREKVSEPLPSEKGISVIQSVIIGFMQGFGTLPGISRSGSTIAGALFSKLDAKSAGDYSFIVSIPAILGAFILELKDLAEISSSVGFWPVFAGCLAAFIVGYFSLSVLMKLIYRGKIVWFSAYLIPLGIAGLILL
ncbi:MAG: undecaprenyl-diphosphate phosphatase [Treponema sp.]|nr:undecaprenyl-diphosphate phosphatase [Treponema sp.]